MNFGGKPIEPPALGESGKPAGGPANRRAELWSNLKKVLEGRFSLPDSDSIHADLTSVGYKYRPDGRLLLESKEDMRKRGMPSPDEGDAVALCFTEPEGSPFPQSNNFHRKIVYPGGDRPHGMACSRSSTAPSHMTRTDGPTELESGDARNITRSWHHFLIENVTVALTMGLGEAA